MNELGLMVLVALGAAGLYLALAGRQRRLGGVALIMLAGAGAMLVALVAPRLAGGATRGWFIVLAVVGLLGAVRMITHRRPVYSALYFILVVVATAGLLVLMQAEFVAAALIIIYAGAILVTYVFVIMLAQQSEPAAYDTRAHEPAWGCIGGFLVLATIAARMLGEPAEPLASLPAADASYGGTVGIGTHLLTSYVIALQVAGVLLLAALVGALAIARRKSDQVMGEAD